jgi:LuxR family maltose regulon positive regulatory protein
MGEELLPEPLSGRELEVLQLMALGAANKEIAARLFIAVTTVKKHVGNILVKLDAANRGEAVAHARDLGLLH